MMWPYIKLRHFVLLSGALLTGPVPLIAQRVDPPLPVVSRQAAGPFPISASDPLAVLVIGGSLMMATILPDVVGPELPYARCAPCDSTRVVTWAIDRVAVGPYRAIYSDISWFTLVATVGGALWLVGEGDDGIPASGDRDVNNIRLMYTGLVTAAATTWLKIAFHRPRPIRYTVEATRYRGRDNGRSFPSGHASGTFAMAVGAATIVAMQGAGGERAPTTAILLTGASATAVLRVLAHRHFPTDVAAGALLGTLAGLLVPRAVR